MIFTYHRILFGLFSLGLTRLAVNVACMGGMRGCIQGYGEGRSEGRRTLGKSRSRREDNIKMVLQEVRWGSTDWIVLAQDRDRWRAL